MLRHAAQTLSEALHGPSFRNSGLSAIRQWYSVKVVVPQMGDSISEGSVAAVLKQPGEQVRENDAILQIETDKVTIDVKSPVDGTLVGLLVKADDTVTPGQLVGTVDESTAKANLIGAQPMPAPKQAQADTTSSTPTPAPKQESSSAPAPHAPSTPDSGAAHSRRMGIHFPPRRTANGDRISALEAAEAHRLQQEQQPSSSASGSDLSSSSGGYGNVDQASTPKAAPAAAAKATPGQPAAPAGKRGAAVTQLKEMPPKRELTEAEIEAIMLGGA